MIPAPFLFLADWADTSPGTFIPAALVALTVWALGMATIYRNLAR